MVKLNSKSKMAPKPLAAKPTGRKKKLALIKWCDSPFSDIIELSAIPKAAREVNSKSKVLWKDEDTGKQERYEAIVIAISGK